MAKWDVYKERAVFFEAKPAPAIVDLPAAKYLAIEGQGAPADDAFQAAVAAIYAVAYTTKMRLKRAGHDFRVATLEATWWSSDGRAAQGAEAFLSVPRAKWCWRLLLMVPDTVTEAEVARTKRELAEKKKAPAAARVALVTLHEGRCVQALHVGPYATEPETVRRMQDTMRAEGLRARGAHHEIYLGDPRRTKPERLRTILRQPVT